MPARKANAVWNGTLKEGNGTVKLGSGAYEGSYSFGSRFEDGSGTNPEELLGAGLAGCYSMALANRLSSAGFTVNSVDTEAEVHLERGEAGLSISRINLKTTGSVEGLDAAAFKENADETLKTCIVARALGATSITVESTLV